MSIPQEQEPTVRAGHMDRGTVLSHPAFGQITISRVSSSHGQNLYGADFKHSHFLELTIVESELVRDLSYDRHSPGRQLIQVSMTEAQWATFVSSPNTGGGTPCTLERIYGKGVPAIPARRQEDVAKSEVKEQVASLVKSIDKAIAEVGGVIGQSLSNVKRDKIMDHLHALRATVSAGIPWVAQQFDEHMETTVEHAKVEVNAYMQSAIQRAGLQAIAAANGMPLQLTPETGAGKDSDAG